MNTTEFFKYLFLMAGVTYLIRALPFAMITKKIKNPYIKSFLYYIPFAVLSAMTIPAVFYATGNVYSAMAGLLVAILFSYREKSLTTVALLSCTTVFIIELLFKIF